MIDAVNPPEVWPPFGAFSMAVIQGGSPPSPRSRGSASAVRGEEGVAEGQRASVEVVRWTEPELPTCLDALVAEAVGSGHAWAADFHATWRSRPFTGEGEALFLASGSGHLLAMAAISADPFVDDAVTGRLRFIYVRRTARRRGIADQLVAACLARGGRHWRRLRLHTDNAAAARLYVRHGFRPSEADPCATHVMASIPPHHSRRVTPERHAPE